VSAKPPLIDSCYRFETPEAVHLWYAPVGPVVRAQAWLRDGLVKLLLYILVMVTNHWLDFAGAWLAMIAFFCLEWFYPVVFEVLNDGMTPAKQWMGIRVVRTDGTPVTWSDSLVRNLMRLVDFMPFLYLGGLVSMMCNGRFQRLGDLAADTVVIYNAPTKLTPRQLCNATPEPAPFALTREEQQAFIELGERSKLLSPARQAELAAIVAPVLSVTEAQALPRCQALAASLTGQT
jgi:uncharacterized RDD family membrane protein YckC